MRGFVSTATVTRSSLSVRLIVKRIRTVILTLRVRFLFPNAIASDRWPDVVNRDGELVCGCSSSSSSGSARLRCDSNNTLIRYNSQDIGSVQSTGLRTVGKSLVALSKWGCLMNSTLTLSIFPSDPYARRNGLSYVKIRPHTFVCVCTFLVARQHCCTCAHTQYFENK